MKPWLKTLLAVLGAGTLGSVLTPIVAPVVAPVVAPAPQPITPPPPAVRVVPAYPSAEQVAVTARMLAEHNRARAARGLPALKTDDRLICSATLEAADNANRGTLDHFGRAGSTPWSRAQLFGVPATAPMSENIAEGTVDEAETTRAWLSDPPHAENVLGPYTHMGGAMWKANDGTIFWAADYCTLP